MNLNVHAARWADAHQPAPPAPRLDGYILLLQDERGLVLIEHTENPALLINRMQAEGLQVQDRRKVTVHSRHAREIALSLRQQFRDHRKQDLPQCWFSVDWQPVVTALEDWDVTEGRLMRAGDLVLGAQVRFTWLDQRHTGEIHGFRQEGTRRLAHVRVAKATSIGQGVTLLAAWCPVNELQPLITSQDAIGA